MNIIRKKPKKKMSAEELSERKKEFYHKELKKFEREYGRQYEKFTDYAERKWQKLEKL